MSYSMLAGIGPLGTPELIIIGILFVVPMMVLAVVIGFVIWYLKKEKAAKANQGQVSSVRSEPN